MNLVQTFQKRYTYIELFICIILRNFNDLRENIRALISICELIRRIFQLCFLSQTFVTETISLSMPVSSICMKYAKQWQMLVKIFRIMYEKMKMSSFLDLTFDSGYRKSAPY
jgi:hypothetical protein